MIDKIQELIDKYEVLENEADTFEIQHNIGCFLTDLQELLKVAKEKKKVCCEKKEGRFVKITSCSDCPFVRQPTLLRDFCGNAKLDFPKEIEYPDTIPEWCPI